MRHTPAIILTLLLTACAQAQSTISLDVGNDTDYEWTAPGSFTGPERLDAKGGINRYVRGGCWCVGCIYDSSSGNCTVPVIFSSATPGNLTINDVSLRFESGRLISDVGYGMSYRWSEGGCWRIDYTSGAGLATTPELPVPPQYKGGDCSAEPILEYRLSSHDNPATDDAIDDAVYRLLDEKLDSDQDGVIDVEYNENMTFNAEGRIGVQRMWGPIQMRLIVWA